MNFLEQWIEYDYNPFIVFYSDGKVKSLNQEAQYLLARVSNRTIFDLALSYAKDSFGFNTIFIDLELDKFKFFALTVGYENESEIGIKLYKIPQLKVSHINTHEAELINIYALIDLAISTNSISSQNDFIKDFDPTIPDIRVVADKFLKLLNKIYATTTSSKIYTKVSIGVGEYIKISDKKYSILKIEINSKRDIQKDNYIRNLANDIGINIILNSENILLELALITK